MASHHRCVDAGLAFLFLGGEFGKFLFDVRDGCLKPEANAKNSTRQHDDIDNTKGRMKLGWPSFLQKVENRQQ